MILQALTRYYEDMLSQGKIAPEGWSKAKVSYALELSSDGQLLTLLPLQSTVMRGQKEVLAPQELDMPSPVKRSSGVAANFLCDTSSYLLGADAKGKPQRTAECFSAAKELHIKLLSGVSSPAAQAIIAFFECWQPELAAQHPKLQDGWNDIMKGCNITFWYNGRPAANDEAIRQAWQLNRSSNKDESNCLCLVTGSHTPTARLHPNIKGVVGAQSSGASLVSFNAPSFCSYGHEQGDNSPTSEYAAFAYTTALNALLADREHVCRMGDTTVVCWATGAQTACQDFMCCFFSDAQDKSQDTLTEDKFRAALFELAKGHAYNWSETATLDPHTHVYILGLAPNAARLAVSFFWQDTLQTLASNVAAHYERLRIVRPQFEQYEFLSVKALLRETVRIPKAAADKESSSVPAPNPRLAGDLLFAILNNSPYPATLLNGAELRIHAERKVNRGRAAIIKAYYLKNSNNNKLKEVMTVELNEQSTYTPYVLGRLFAVLEAVQNAANPNINTTIADRYFNSASATPANVFPALINLANKHLSKLSDNQKIYYSKKVTELISRMQETFPKRLTLEEQGAFQIGYYHETQKRYTKKEEN